LHRSSLKKKGPPFGEPYVVPTIFRYTKLVV
jgi:hypothetical protein